MDLNFILVKPLFTFEEVLEKVQKHIEGKKRDMPTVLVVDEKGRIEGFIPERVLLFPPQNAKVEDQTVPLPVVSHKMDREKVMQVMARMRSEVLVVADEAEQVMGIIHLRDLMKVAQAEATEDIYRFAGVDVEAQPMDSVFLKVKRRYNWLLINLVTAFMASFVVSLFQDTISRFAILAVFMPIVAGQGGNAATQALAVVVRGLAVGELNWSKARKVIFREASAGVINGVITGTAAACAAIAFGAPPVLGFCLMAAMIINFFVAGFFGALIPLILKRLKIDPAVASSVFVTTMTDIFGFLAFLGLGSLFMT
jgi:magnesium transporter